MRSIVEIKERSDTAHLMIAKFGADGEKTVCYQSMEDIPQLLTTIESQSKLIEAQVDHINTINAQFEHQIKEGNSSLRDCEVESEGAESTIYELKFQIISKNLLIESQKEEIENQREIIAHQGKGLLQERRRIESLKAITELAVKEMKLELEAAKTWEMHGTAKRIANTLSEIERLQNG